MEGKISKIKNTEDELLLPVTTAEAVYMEDGETLNDEIKNINSSLDNIKNSTIAYNVMNYGFDDKGGLDNTQKLNDLINLVAENGGGIIKFPTGKFKLENQIVMKPYVYLEGAMPWRGKHYEGYTVFLCHSLNKAQFLLREYCSLANFYFDYPNQVGGESDEPIPYEWTIKTDTNHLCDDIQLSNLYLPNAYKGICLERAGRFNLNNIYGQPIKHGLFIDNVLDVGNINRVEFWTFNYYVGSNMYNYILNNGTAFEFKKIDGFLANNLFAYGYNKCYHLNGEVWGTFNGCCSDKCYHPILVDNCNIVEFIGGAFIGSSNKSVICKINNVYDSFKVIGCNFFGGCTIGVLNKSDSGKILIDCNFKNKDNQIAIPILNSANNYITVRRHGDEHLIGFCNVDGVKNLKASDNVVLSLNKSNLELGENVTDIMNGFKVNIGEQVNGEKLIIGRIRIDDKNEIPKGYYYLEFKMKGKITTDRKRFGISIKKDVGEPVFNWLIGNLPLIDDEIIIRLPLYLYEKPYITLLAIDISYYDEPIATGDYIDITDMKIIKMNNLLNSSIEEIYKQSYVYSSKVDYDL